MVGKRDHVTLGLAILLSLAPFNPRCLAEVSAGAPGLAAGREEAARLEHSGGGPFRVHDPSTIVRCHNTYWVFHTGRGISSACSTNLVDWVRGPRVFTTAPSWVADVVPGNRRLYYWAPDIIQHQNGYLLYYSVSTFGNNTSAIALATNPTLDPNDPLYEWEDQGVVIRSNDEVDYNAIDPALFRDDDDSLWMAFGSFWSGIKMIQLDPRTGKRHAPDSPLYALAHHDSIEAPFIHRRGDSYYLFVNWGFCCRGTNSTYEIRIGRSDKVTGPYFDREGKALLAGGGTLLLATDGVMIGPGHAGILREGGQDWFTFHFYDGTRRGTPTFAIRPLNWTEDGWPELAPARTPAHHLRQHDSGSESGSGG